jgi:hypothetical protein
LLVLLPQCGEVFGQRIILLVLVGEPPFLFGLLESITFSPPARNPLMMIPKADVSNARSYNLFFQAVDEAVYLTGGGMLDEIVPP